MSIKLLATDNIGCEGDRMDILGMKILSIDDNRNNLLMIEVLGKSLGIQVTSFENPILALEEAVSREYDLIVIDYMMPEMDGVSFIKSYRIHDDLTPIIMVTAVGDDHDVHYQALEAGATDFLKKPINGTLFKLRVQNLLLLKKSSLLLEDRAKHLEEEVKLATRSVLDRELESLSVIGKTAEYKDPETGEHIARVAAYSLIMAKALGMNESLQDILYHAAPLHDIGKVGIPDDILLKPGKLDDLEWVTMRTHTQIGYNILRRTRSKYLNAGAIIAYTHHERWDGSGYPSGLSGDKIPLLGRVVAIADVFDALTTKRPYKEAWGFDESIAELVKMSGHHFDPELVDIFMSQKDAIKEIYQSMDIDVNENDRHMT